MSEPNDDDLTIADCQITTRGEAALELIRALKLWRAKVGQSRTGLYESEVHALVETDDTTFSLVMAIQQLVLVLLDEREKRQ